MLKSFVADLDPGSGAFLTLDTGYGNIAFESERFLDVSEFGHTISHD
jgi:hypothetical protein